MDSSVPVPPVPGKPKLLDQIRDFLRVKQYSLRTEEAYLQWIKRFILFHGKRHPDQLGSDAIRVFLTALAEWSRWRSGKRTSSSTRVATRFCTALPRICW
jgi:hypothetical protein